MKKVLNLFLTLIVFCTILYDFQVKAESINEESYAYITNCSYCSGKGWYFVCNCCGTKEACKYGNYSPLSYHHPCEVCNNTGQISGPIIRFNGVSELPANTLYGPVTVTYEDVNTNLLYINYQYSNSAVEPLTSGTTIINSGTYYFYVYIQNGDMIDFSIHISQPTDILRFNNSTASPNEMFYRPLVVTNDLYSDNLSYI